MPDRDLQPRVSRPSPKGYFLEADQGTGLLPWSHATDQLERARNYWLATSGSDGRPHCMPVWGIWIDEHFVFSTGPTTKKARNLTENPNAVIHLESGAQVVILECRVREVTASDALEAFRITYNAKYDWDFTTDQLSAGGVFGLWPITAFAWCGDHGEEFSGTATRWKFGGSQE